MANLGTLKAYFQGDTSNLQAAFGQVSQQATTTGSRMKQALNFGAIAGSADVLRQGIVALTGEANDSERSFNTLKAALDATDGAIGMTADEISAMAGSMSKLTAIDDEAIQDAQSVLLTFGNIGRDVFPKATTAVLDMATAMNGGAQPSAEQLANTSRKLGKALDDPIGGLSALSKMGVRFTDQQKEQIKTLVESGKTMDAQKIILEELSSKFGGQAAARLQTFQGRLDNMKISAGNLSAELGKPLQALTPFLAAAPGAAMVFNGLKTGVVAAGGAFGFLSSGAAAVAAPAALPAATGAATATAGALAGGGGLAASATVAAGAIAFSPGALVAAIGAMILATVTAIASIFDYKSALQDASARERDNSDVLKDHMAKLRERNIWFDEAYVKTLSTAEALTYLANQTRKSRDATKEDADATKTATEEKKKSYQEQMDDLDNWETNLKTQYDSALLTEKEYRDQSYQIAFQRQDAWNKSSESVVAGFQKVWAELAKLSTANNGGVPVPAAGTTAPPAFADGTDYAPGGWSLVGERGPELMNVPRGAQILDSQTTKSMLAASGGININISGVKIGSDMDIRSVARQLGEMVRDEVAARGIR